MKVFRDISGNVINIGEWDYLQTEGDSGDVIINNPLPVGATESDEEVVEGPDGGLYVIDDPRILPS